MNTKDTTLTDTLETLVDKHGLAWVLIELSEICSLKAEHINSNWQDPVTARPWEAMARRLDTLQGVAMKHGLDNH